MREQEANQRRMLREERRVKTMTLLIPVHSSEEREHVRSHVAYSGAGDDYVATFMGELPLAVTTLLRLRGARVATIYQKHSGEFVLETVDNE